MRCGMAYAPHDDGKRIMSTGTGRRRKGMSARDRARWFIMSFVSSLRLRKAFRNVKTFCLFLGTPRSGHSLVGALIDAHPHAIISHELNALEFFLEGFTREQIWTLILQRSRRYAVKKLSRGGYAYDVPNQWQGRYERLSVIGDKKGGGSVDRLKAYPELLANLKRRMGTDVRFVHVTRNPFDNIATIQKRTTNRKKTLTACVNGYFSRCEGVMDIREKAGPSAIHHVRHESIIADPKSALSELCAFLSLETSQGYLDDCASIIYAKPHKSRHGIPWTDDVVELVERRIGEFLFLEGYSFHA